MKWILILALVALSPKAQQQVDQIDAQIEQLQDMKRGYEARAIRAEDQADRLQFENKFLLESRRYYQIAEENREKAERVQEEIDRLEAKKRDLMRNG